MTLRPIMMAPSGGRLPSYAGIGSRKTPEPYLRKFRDVARQLALMGWVLRSGGAEGADTAFERGCDDANGAKSIFLPWENFNGNRSRLYPPTEEALALVAEVHPAWWRCKPSAKQLLARDAHQILGQHLDEPVDMGICWTPNAALVGGTALALRITARYAPRARVFNAGAIHVDDGERWNELLTWAKAYAAAVIR